MAVRPVRPRELFDSGDSIELVNKFESYKDTLSKSFQDPISGPLDPESLRMRKALTGARGTLNKAASVGLIDSVSEAVQRQQGFIGKDLDLAGPGTTGGLHAYDLEAPAKQLVPRDTPLRNRIARQRGVGVAHEYKRITGYTGAKTGGLPLIHPGQSETATVTFGSLALRRGAKISYNGDDIVVPYRRFALSDEVSWDAQFAGQGYQDLRQLSTTSTLYAMMLLEERMLLAGRGTASGFSGELPAPSTPTVTTPAASGDQVAVTGGTGSTVYVDVRATTMWGSGAAGSSGSSAFTAGDVISATWTQVPGATGYDVFVAQASSTPAASALFYVGSTAGNSIVIQGALPTSGRSMQTAITSTAYDAGYDGILSYVLDPDKSGYLNYLNGPLTSDAPFQDAFAAMWDARSARPETILCNGNDRRTLSNFLTSTSSASYRIEIQSSTTSGNQAAVGALATAIQNEVTGDLVDLEVHPYLERGTMPILSWTLPLPDSNISNTWAVVNNQDYIAVEWPVIEFAYANSVYFQGTFCAYAPEWSGCIAGITAA